MVVDLFKELELQQTTLYSSKITDFIILPVPAVNRVKVQITEWPSTNFNRLAILAWRITINSVMKTNNGKLTRSLVYFGSILITKFLAWFTVIESQTNFRVFDPTQTFQSVRVVMNYQWQVKRWSLKRREEGELDQKTLWFSCCLSFYDFDVKRIDYFILHITKKVQIMTGKLKLMQPLLKFPRYFHETSISIRCA